MLINYLFYLEMISVSGGTFRMGSREGKKNERPVRAVTLDSFQIGKFEITQAQWQAVMGENPSYYPDCPNCPVENVSWEDVWEWCSDVYTESNSLNSQSKEIVSRSSSAEPNDGTLKVLRGGSWSYSASRCRSTRRGKAPFHYKNGGGGFRVVRSL